MKEEYKYKVSVVFTTNGSEEDTEKTLKLLSKQTIKIQVIMVDISDKPEIASICSKYKEKHLLNYTYIYAPGASIIHSYNLGFKEIQGKWTTCVNSGDIFQKNYCEAVYRYMMIGRCKDLKIATVFKTFFDGADTLIDSFTGTNSYTNCIIDLNEEFDTLPIFINGTFLHKSLIDGCSFNENLNYDSEKEFFYKMLLENRKFAYVHRQKYQYTIARDYHYRVFTGMYYKEWYCDTLTVFLMPFLKSVKERYGYIPAFIQYGTLNYIMCRLDANLDNRNKHVFSKDEALEYTSLLREVLAFIDNKYIFNIHSVRLYTSKPEDLRLLAQIKYNSFNHEANYIYSKRELNAAFGDITAFSFSSMRINIEFMEYSEGRLEIDGSFPDFYDLENIRFYVGINGKNYDLDYNSRYSLTKYFGITAYNRNTFHVSIPLAKDIDEQVIQFKMQYGLEVFKIPPEYKSHTSRLSGLPVHSYWRFDGFIAIHNKTAIIIKRFSKSYAIYKELMLLKELFFERKPKYFMALGLRILYWLYNPFYGKKNIWLFFDKIYKGGDSSEYLYKYTSKQNNKKINAYYLLDKKCADYKRMKKEGFHPVKRGTLKHRMLFLHSNMVIVSNSTVLAFNDYSMAASAFIRGFINFHVVCVQHGMSVQKIAIAQQRLRDNIRLYFCASKYEIENLSQPIYDYLGYDALKLTGVPRYDGLVNDDKKQLLISPTWRMQAAVLVSKNEGVERDYNPNFKDTSYFNVYNSLINDHRLISAAKKYGYSIAYVLHPIVSPQAEDFDKNDYVDIIPATGDMSYEKMFCESSLMVTDYSGIQFDFAYMRKPLIYLHHDDIPQHYEEGTYHYDTMAFGEICRNNDELINLLIDYMEHGCTMKPEYKRRADDFFEFDDHNNCQRIYDEMIKFQGKHLFN